MESFSAEDCAHSIGAVYKGKKVGSFGVISVFSFHALKMLTSGERASIDYGVNVDLTTEVAVSGFIYLNKNLLFKHSTQVKIHSSRVQSLQPYADLVVVAAHCMYKEQIYMLSDYYTFALLSQYCEKALRFAEKMHAKLALKTALKLTHDITVDAFDADNALANRLGVSFRKMEINLMPEIGKNFDLPLKYPFCVVLKGLSEKIREDPNTRKSLPIALISTIRPRSINKFLAHVKRKGY